MVDTSNIDLRTIFIDPTGSDSRQRRIQEARQNLFGGGPRSGGRSVVFQRGEAQRAEGARRNRVSELLSKVQGDLGKLSDAERTEVQRLRGTISARAERREIIRAGGDPFSRQRRLLNERRASLEREVASRNAQADRLATKERSLNAEFNRLDKLSTAGQLQFGVAQKFNAEIRAFEKEIQAFNRVQSGTEGRVESFEAQRLDVNRNIQGTIARSGVPLLPGDEVKEVRGLPRGEIRAGVPPPLIPDVIRAPARDILRGTGTAGESAFGAAFGAGQVIAGAIPRPVGETIIGGLKASPAASGLFGDLFTGKIRGEEAKKRVIALGGPFAQVGTVTAASFFGGPVAIGAGVTAGLAAGKPEDVLLGGLFGGVAGLGKAGTTFLKLVGGRTGQIARFGERAVGKGLIPGTLGISLLGTGAELRGARGEQERIRRIGFETAGGFGAFISGARFGGAFATQFFGPLEATASREIFIRRQRARGKITKKDVSQFRKFSAIAKEVNKLGTIAREPSLSDRLNLREKKVILKFLKDQGGFDVTGQPKVALFGSGAVEAQVPLKIRKTIKPKDLDISAVNPPERGRELINLLRASGSKDLRLDKTGTTIRRITAPQGQRKIIEIKPRERLLASFESVRGPFELQKSAFIKTSSGISLFKLSAQAKRQAIGGAIEQPRLRQKDLERLQTLSRTFTPEQLETARLRATQPPRVTRAAIEFRGFLGQQRGSLFPGRERFKIPIETVSFGGRPFRPGRLGGISFLPQPSQTSVFTPSRLPTKPQPSRLAPIGKPSRLSPFFPAGPSALRIPTQQPPSLLPGIPGGPRIPPTTPKDFSFLAPPGLPFKSIIPPPTRRITTPPPPTPGRSRLPPPPIPPTFPPFTGGALTQRGLFGRAKEQKVPGYNAFVKSKPFKKKKFRKVTRRPLPRANALQRGFFVADNTIAQSVKIKKAKKLVRAAPPPLFSLAGKFAFKPKKNVHIERRGSAIDTPGEVVGLKVGKFLAQERRGFFGGFGLRPTPKRRKRRKK